MDSIANGIPNGIIWAILGVILCVVALLLFKSATMQAQLKKAFVLLLMAAAVLFGYYLVTGESPTMIPTRIDNFFNAPREPEQGSHRYYQDPDERYKDKM